MKKEKTVKTHTRKTKSGKTVTVKQHTAKYDAAEQAKDIVKKAGAGAELERVKKAKMQEDPYKDFGFTAEEFAEWYEGTGSAADKKVEKALRKALGRKAYDELNDVAAEGYKKGGAAKFFTKEVGVVKPAAKETPTPKEPKAKKTKEETPVVKEKTPRGKKSDKVHASGITEEDWDHYQNDGSDQKIVSRVERALKKYLGAKGYEAYGDYQDKSINGEGVSLEGDYKSSMALLDKFKKGKGAVVEKKLSKKYKEALEEPKSKKPKATTKEASKSGNLQLTATNKTEAERILRDPAYTVGFRKGKNGETIMTYSDESTGKAKLSAKAKKEREQWADETMQEFFGPKTTKTQKDDWEQRREMALRRGAIERNRHPQKPTEPKSSNFGKSKIPKEPRMASFISVGGKNYMAVRPNSEHNIGEYLFVREGKVYRESEKGFRRVYKKHLGEEAYNYVLGVATKTSETEGKTIKKVIAGEPTKPKSPGVGTGAIAVKYKGKTYHVTRDGKVETGTGKQASPLLASRVLKSMKESAESQPQSRKRKKKNTPEEDAALDATLAEIRERNKQPYQVSRRV